MPRRRSRGPGSSGVRRRAVLGTLATGVAGLGIGHGVVTSSSYTSGSAGRGSQADIAGDTNGALLELLVADSVQKNQQSLLCEITNNAGETLAIDVSLDDPSQGTLTGPNGSGSTVSLTLSDGGTGSVDLTSGEPDGTVVPFSILHSGTDFSFDIARQTTVKSGNTSGEVSIDKINKFRADAAADEWTIKTLEASSTNYDLDTVELTVEEQSTGDVVSTKTYDSSSSYMSGTEFSAQGTGSNPAITLQPDSSSYDIQSGDTYVLTVTATDTNGNFAQDTSTWTAK